MGKKYKCVNCHDIIICHGGIQHYQGEPCKVCDRVDEEWREKAVPTLIQWAENKIKEYQNKIKNLQEFIEMERVKK